MADYGIKISRQGYDVKTIPSETNKQNFVILDTTNSLIVYLSGRVSATTTITHNLGYVPVFEGYKIDNSASTVQMIRPDDSEWSIKATTTTVTVTKLYSGTTYDCFYVIFME